MLKKNIKQIVVAALLLLVLGIILGAFGAHGLKGKMSAEKIMSYETGVRYQLLNAIALIGLAGLSSQLHFSLKVSFVFILSGVILFSGSIYGLTLQEITGVQLNKILGPITPMGGLLIIIGWTIVLINVVKQKAI